MSVFHFVVLARCLDQRGKAQRGHVLPLVKNHVIPLVRWWGQRVQKRGQNFKVEVQPGLAGCCDSGCPTLSLMHTRKGLPFE